MRWYDYTPRRYSARKLIRVLSAFNVQKYGLGEWAKKMGFY